VHIAFDQQCRNRNAAIIYERRTTLPLPIEDYALIGNARTAALVGRDGSIDWLCLPRFDSAACFAALLGDARHGRWLLAPAEEPREVRRAYRKATLLLETEWETDSGRIRVTDFMPHWEDRDDLVRLVEGLSGQVEIRTELAIRFGYGEIVPWVEAFEGGLVAKAGRWQKHR
jgi:GH15 family glucan-1,4-alpha-glucosidase